MLLDFRDSTVLWWANYIRHRCGRPHQPKYTEASYPEWQLSQIAFLGDHWSLCTSNPLLASPFLPRMLTCHSLAFGDSAATQTGLASPPYRRRTQASAALPP